MTTHQTLQKHFGYSNFRPGQEDIINAILAKKDTLAILPTGGGKSLCFQIPGLVLEGTTLVISPLISLMKDQVDALLNKNISATYINSSLDKKEVKNRLTNLANQKYKFVYIAPERLQTKTFLAACHHIKIPFIAIDEAHCISMWGHDFRPEYTQIYQFVDQLKSRPTLAAFTATATEKVRQDIITSLRLKKPQIFLNSFSRDNLKLYAFTCADNFSQELILFKVLKQHRHQSGVIYASTQKKTEYLAALIKHYWGDDFPVSAYHAGLENKQRAHIQDQFLSNQLQIITATNAFGMGVDKANVRFVIHYQLPGNLENYYQEAGRGGRDGKSASCYLLFNPVDIEIQKIFINSSHPDEDSLLRKHQLHQLQQMINYANSHSCRMKFILNYFDENHSNCEQCDSCTHFQLSLDALEKQYYQLLSQIKNSQILTPNLIHLLTVHQPQTKAEFLKIPGIGAGWIEKWYNQLSKLLDKGTANVNDSQTTYRRI